MPKPVHTSDTMKKLHGVLASGPAKGQAIEAALNIVRKRRDAGGIANDPTMKNPVGWSSIYPPQYMSNQDPNVSPVVSRGSMTDLAALGTLGRKGYVTAAELPAAEAKAKQAIDYGMVAASASSPLKGIRAFHGSPHTFDRFSLDKIGTGEGAQAYGHGLYFAGNEGVARTYKFAGQPSYMNGNVAAIAQDAITAAAKAGGDDVLAGARNILWGKRQATTDAILRRQIDDAYNNIEALTKPGGVGSMYEVNLRTSPDRLLDWDKPLRDQAKPVQDALANFRDTPGDYARALEVWRQPQTGGRRFLVGDVTQKLEREMGVAGSRTGGEWYDMARRPTYGGESAEQVAAKLKEAGIDGIQYLDAGSRAAGDGTRNYVMFDDKLIDILRRYGLLGMIGGGGAAAVDGMDRASGGAVDAAMRIVRQKRATGGAVGTHTGPIHSAVAGRTDHLPMHVQSGSYVIPADIVSAMGEGNTMAGFKQINAMFGDHAAPAYADGGATKPPVPIVAAGGEYVLSPAQVMQAGDGDMDMGHRVLDEWIKRMRAKTIKTLTKLPGPKKD